MDVAIIISLCSAVFTGISSYIAWKQYKSSEKKIDKFRDTIRNNFKILKNIIIAMDNNLTGKDKILFIENVHDLTLYQINEKEKEIFLTKQENYSLSKIQEDIEDYIGNIFAATDPEINKQMAIASIKTFLKEL